MQLQINPTFIDDTAEAETGPEPESRQPAKETLSIETKSETFEPCRLPLDTRLLHDL